MLTIEQQRTAVTLAMQVETGEADFEQILEKFKKYPNLATNIITFWFGFNEMTKNALQMLILYKSKKHLENCLRQNWRTKWNTIIQYVVWKLKTI